jgi:SAM-dependent methyltransferase
MQMKPMPLAGVFCLSPDEAIQAPVYPLTWVRCVQCGLVQVQEDIPDQILFSRYNYASSTVAGLVRHFTSYAEELTGRYACHAAPHFLEIGCNDGVLLNRLPPAWRRTGVDPSDVAARAASAGTGYELLNAPFSPSLVRQARIEGSVDVISGSNCLAHISNLFEVFSAAALALKPGGHFWIEVHDLQALLHGGQWDTIYHEHKVEWSESALRRCLALHGFELLQTSSLPLHGGLLRCLFRKVGRGGAPSGEQPVAESGLAAMQEAYERRYDTPAARKLAALQSQGGRIAAYGAAGRANVYLNQMRDLRFAYIVDESPLRMGKFIPSVGTPIVSPVSLADSPADACLVTAWNYREEIVRKNPAHRGSWLTAFAQ